MKHLLTRIYTVGLLMLTIHLSSVNIIDDVSISGFDNEQIIVNLIDEPMGW